MGLHMPLYVGAAYVLKCRSGECYSAISIGIHVPEEDKKDFLSFILYFLLLVLLNFYF